MLTYGGNSDHFTVSVEFEKADTQTHPHTNKEVQLLEIANDFTLEEFNITVTGAMGGKYQIRWINPLYDSAVKGSVRSILSDSFKDNDTAGNV